MVTGPRFKWDLAIPENSSSLAILLMDLQRPQGNAVFTTTLLEPLDGAAPTVAVLGATKFDPTLKLPDIASAVWQSKEGTNEETRAWFIKGYEWALNNWQTDPEGAADKICSRLEFLLDGLCQRHKSCHYCRDRKMGGDAPNRLESLTSCAYSNGFSPNIVFDEVQKLLGADMFSSNSGKREIPMGETNLRTRMFHGYPKEPMPVEVAQAILALQVMVHVDFKRI